MKLIIQIWRSPYYGPTCLVLAAILFYVGWLLTGCGGEPFTVGNNDAATSDPACSPCDANGPTARGEGGQFPVRTPSDAARNPTDAASHPDASDTGIPLDACCDGVVVAPDPPDVQSDTTPIVDAANYAITDADVRVLILCCHVQGATLTCTNTLTDASACGYGLICNNASNQCWLGDTCTNQGNSGSLAPCP